MDKNEIRQQVIDGVHTSKIKELISKRIFFRKSSECIPITKTNKLLSLKKKPKNIYNIYTTFIALLQLLLFYYLFLEDPRDQSSNFQKKETVG